MDLVETDALGAVAPPVGAAQQAQHEESIDKVVVEKLQGLYGEIKEHQVETQLFVSGVSEGNIS